MRPAASRPLGLAALVLALLASPMSSRALEGQAPTPDDLRQRVATLLDALGGEGEDAAASRLHGEIRGLWTEARREGRPPRLAPALGDSLYDALLAAWDRIRSPAARSAVARSLPTFAPERAAADFTALFARSDWRSRVEGAVKPLIYAIARAENPAPRLRRIAGLTRDPEVMRAIAIARQGEAGYAELCALFDLSVELADDPDAPLPAPRVDVCWPALAESLAVDPHCRMARHFATLAGRLGPVRALDYLRAHPDPACPALREIFLDVILRDAPTHADLSRPGESLEERAEDLRALGLTQAQAALLKSRLGAVKLVE